jgi:phosphatidylserine/phosphatidylglycerophosphate/cardiolipin synthase-like enzyme
MNWTLDSWTRQENLVAIVDHPGVAQGYSADFEQLWRGGEVDGTGDFDPPRGDIRAWFTPGRGEELSHRIAAAIGKARRRVRIASPVITTAPVIGTLAQVASEGRTDLAGVIDGTQMKQVFQQWEQNGHSAWKIPVVARVFERAPFSAKPSTPYTPESVHDFMHAKLTVADDVVFAGSFNLSRSGELNAENVLEIHDAAMADRLAAFVDRIRARYPRAPQP